MIAPRTRAPHELTAPELARYLFGDPLDPKDAGLIGRLQNTIETSNKRVDRLLRLAWAIMLLMVAACVTLITDLLVRLGGRLPT